MHKPPLNLHHILFVIKIYVLTGVVLIGSFLSVAAQSSTIVQVTPTTLSMRYGEKAQFSIEIMNVENMYGFELHIYVYCDMGSFKCTLNLIYIEQSADVLR